VEERQKREGGKKETAPPPAPNKEDFLLKGIRELGEGA